MDRKFYFDIFSYRGKIVFIFKVLKRTISMVFFHDWISLAKVTDGRVLGRNDWL